MYKRRKRGWQHFWEEGKDEGFGLAATRRGSATAAEKRKREKYVDALDAEMSVP